MEKSGSIRLLVVSNYEQMFIKKIGFHSLRIKQKKKKKGHAEGINHY